VRELFVPGSVVKPDKEKQRDQKENIINNIRPVNTIFKKQETEIDTQSHIQHQPK
jgi:hypothetical protein